jgi:hypothetical protein
VRITSDTLIVEPLRAEERFNYSRDIRVGNPWEGEALPARLWKSFRL